MRQLRDGQCCSARQGDSPESRDSAATLFRALLAERVASFPPRIAGLDVFRGLAVLAMFAVHARRLERSAASPSSGAAAAASDDWVDTLESALDAAFVASMDAEPVISASFLFLVGVGVALSFRRLQSHDPAAPNAEPAVMRPAAGVGPWHRGLLRRAGVLYALSVGLFAAQFGVVLPDLIVSSGILGVIALALMLVGVTVSSPRAMWAVGAIAVLLTVGLERFALSVPGVNAGPGGALPLVAFAAWGAALWREFERGHARRAFALALTLGVFGLGAWVAGASLTTLHQAWYPAAPGNVALASGPGAARALVTFWNHSSVAVLLFAPLLTMALWAVTRPARVWTQPALSPLRRIGRHALMVYVGHLLLLGLMDLFNVVPRSPLQTALVVVSLFVTSAALARFLEADRFDRLRQALHRHARLRL